MKEIVTMMLEFSQEIKTIKAYVEVFRKTNLEKLSATWVDGQDVMDILHISKRTLQTLRDNESLPYSRINGKFYYKLSDIENMLESNYLSKSDRHANK